MAALIALTVSEGYAVLGGFGFMVTGIVAIIAAAHYGTNVLFSFTSIALLVLALSTFFVPLTWGLGLAEPWSVVEGRELSSVILGGIFFLVFFLAAVPSMRSQARDRQMYITRPTVFPRPHSQIRVLCITAVLSALGLALLLALAGGPTHTLANLANRRELFEGLGALHIPALMAGLAFATYIASPPETKSRFGWSLAIICGCLYLTAAYFSGQKIRIVLLLLAVVVALAREREVRTGAFVLLAVLMVPASTYYHYEVRQVPSLGVAEGELVGDTFVDFISSAWHPFSRSGLDHLRTLSAVGHDAPLLMFRPDATLAAPLTLVPRSLYPEKPPSSSVSFSAEVFPASWAGGTGVPPSLGAEVVWGFGLLGGLACYAIAGYLISTIDRFLARHRGLFASHIYICFTVAAFMMLKAGTDSSLRMLGLFLAATGGLYVASVVSVRGNLEEFVTQRE